MNKIISYLLAVAMLVVSCNEVELENGTGYLSISLEQDNELTVKAPQAPSADMKFAITIYRGTEVFKTIPDYRDLANTKLALPIGTYRVVAHSGENVEAGFDCPYYEGETEVKIVNGQTANASITCSLANVKVAVEFDAKIKENFTEYEVVIKNTSTSSIAFGNIKGTEGKTGYIKADGSLNWELTAKNKENKIYKSSGSYSNVKPRQFYNLKFTLGTDNSGNNGFVVVRITIDETMVEKEYDMTLDFGESKLDISSNPGFDISAPVAVPLGDASEKTLKFNSDKGIKGLVIDMTSCGGTATDLVGATAEQISALTAQGIAVSSLTSGTMTAQIGLTDYVKNLLVGDYKITISLYDMLNHVATKEINISILSDAEADIASAKTWSKFAMVKGKWFSQEIPAGMTFEYKKKADAQWTKVDVSALKMDNANRTFSAEIYGLEPSTEYQFRAVTTADPETRSISSTTDKAEDLYNLSFDDWWKNGKVWYPCTERDIAKNPTIWDTANGGTKILNVFPTLPEETTLAVAGAGKKAAKLESKVAAGNLAAGNIYTGKFHKATLSPVGATLEWGVPFTSKPIALKGHYNYIPKNIDKTSGNYGHLAGKPDIAQIQIMLTDWNGPFQINTGKQQFVKLDDPNIIAYGTIDVNATNGYVEFTIPVEYRDLTRTPKYIVVVGAASKYGDYFTGAVGSVLYLDEFKLVYDPAELTEVEREKVGYRK